MFPRRPRRSRSTSCVVPPCDDVMEAQSKEARSNEERVGETARGHQATRGCAGRPAQSPMAFVHAQRSTGVWELHYTPMGGMTGKGSLISAARSGHLSLVFFCVLGNGTTGKRGQRSEGAVQHTHKRSRVCTWRRHAPAGRGGVSMLPTRTSRRRCDFLSA